MKKRLIGLAIILALLFSLSACSQGLSAYKEDAKQQIDSYSDAKGQNNYSEKNWAAILLKVNAGKTAIDSADSKADVDTAVNDAKTAIDAIEREEIKLKQGTYTTDDKMVHVVLHGENEFSLEIMIMNNLPTGKYEVINGKLILHYMPDVDLYFDIGNNKLIFSEISDNGQLSGEWIISIGTALNLIDS
jgi:hypothetical protein